MGAWLLEDTAKRGPSERDKAIAKAEADNEAARKALVAQALDKVAPGRDGDAKPEQGVRSRLVTWIAGRRRSEPDIEEPQPEPPGPPRAPPTSLRWKLRRAFRSQVRAVVYARTLFVLMVVLFAGWGSIYASTGFDMMDLMRPVDPEDERSRFKSPFFVVESGSMMHKQAPYGRVGTVDPGDVVVIEKLRPGDTIETFYGDGDREVAGAKGDVIMFLPVPVGDAPVDPIIHRAVAKIERHQVPVPNPNAGPNDPPMVLAARFTVAEFGIFSAAAITIPELGLYNYAPREPEQGGYITRGDNQRSNNWADQALGVTPFPVPEDRIIGRLKYEVPVIGLAKLAFTGQNQAQLSPDEDWCAFLAGKAACDTWVVFFALVVVFIVLPLGATSIVFSRRLYVRHLDRVATKRRAAEATAATLAAESGPTSASAARPHAAEDLLAGRVRVNDTVARGDGDAAWDDLVRPGSVEWRDGPS